MPLTARQPAALVEVDDEMPLAAPSIRLPETMAPSKAEFEIDRRFAGAQALVVGDLDIVAALARIAEKAQSEMWLFTIITPRREKC